MTRSAKPERMPAVGDRVEHPVLGRGRISNVEASNLGIHITFLPMSRAHKEVTLPWAVLKDKLRFLPPTKHT